MTAAQFEVRVEANRRLSGGYFLLELVAAAPTPIAAAVPGQFVMVRGEWGRELLNPRAFSILDAPDPARFSILAKTYGEGTRRLSLVGPGDRLTAAGPLGAAFPPAVPGVRDLLVAGGVGLPPLHFYARKYVMSEGACPSERVEMYYGGRDRDDLVLLDDLDAWGVAAHLATEDGSLGVRGYVTAALEPRLDRAAQAGEAVRVLACGPTPMLAAVRQLVLRRGVQAYLCLEENMACGFGVCLGCAVPVYGPKPYRYCCTEGPVFDAREVRWP